MSFNFLKTENGQTTVKEGYLEIYLPKWLSENDLIKDDGQTAQALGIFIFKHAKNEDMTGAKLYQLKLPIKITFKYAEKFNKNISLKGLPGDNYIVYKLYPGDIMNISNSHVQDILDVYSFLTMVTGGRIPDTVGYSQRFKLMIDNLELNGTDLKLPYNLIEILISELTRNKKDLAIPFRIEAAAGKEFGYEQISVKELAMNNSTFSALTFEDLNHAILNSVNKTITNSPERPTPVETVVKY